MFPQSDQYSPEKNNVMNDLARIYDTVSSAGKFKSNYDELKHVIEALNSRCKQYNSLSKSSIKSDVVDALVESINFEELSKDLAKRLHNNTKPEDGLQWMTLQSISAIELTPYQTDEIESMHMCFPQVINSSARPQMRKFMTHQANAISYAKEFLNAFTSFEDTMQKYRDECISRMQDNLRLIVNEHYKVAYNKRNNKDYPIPDTIIINNVELPFKTKQADFIKSTIKLMVNAEMS